MADEQEDTPMGVDAGAGAGAGGGGGGGGSGGGNQGKTTPRKKRSQNRLIVDEATHVTHRGICALSMLLVSR